MGLSRRDTSSEAEDLEAWTAEALSNSWVPCLDESPSERFIATDASEWGWGAIFLDVASGLVDFCSVPWSQRDRNSFDVSHSAHAEPEAVFRALCRFVRPGDSRPVSVLTDSTTAKHSLPKGYSPSFVVNAIASRCQSAFPSLRLDTHHVPGALNGVDPLSRGLPLPADPESTVRRMMGVAGCGGSA